MKKANNEEDIEKWAHVKKAGFGLNLVLDKPMPYTEKNRLIPFWALGYLEKVLGKPFEDAFVVRELSPKNGKMVRLIYYFKVQRDEGVNLLANKLMLLTADFLEQKGMSVKPDLPASGFMEDKRFEEIRHWASGIVADWKSKERSPDFDEKVRNASRAALKKLEDEKLVKKYFAVSTSSDTE